MSGFRIVSGISNEHRLKWDMIRKSCHMATYAQILSPRTFNPIEYLFASEIECPQAFYGEDARDYALEGMIDGYIPRCKFARLMLALPRALPIKLKGIAV